MTAPGTPPNAGPAHATPDLSRYLPLSLLTTEAMVSHMRRYLQLNGLGTDWQIYCADHLGLDRVDEFLKELGEPAATWETPMSLTNLPGAGQPVEILGSIDCERITTRNFGFLFLRGAKVIVGRWAVPNPEHGWRAFELLAAPSQKHCQELAHALHTIMDSDARPEWTVIGGPPWRPHWRIPRDADIGLLDKLVLGTELRDRLEREVMSFFSEPVEALYAQMGVAYRRGILFFGPPGCGKSSICRAVAGRNLNAQAMLLRPGARFDGDDMERVFYGAMDRTPSILVLEDIDLLLAQRSVSVSNFLNLMDGIDQPVDGGFLVLATTNNPQNLATAVSNRPGRFTAVEVPGPNHQLRRRYFAAVVDGLDPGTIAKLANDTEGLGFAHLQEIVAIAGLLALDTGRSVRVADDLRRASELVMRGHDDAEKGFSRVSKSFGFQGKADYTVEVPHLTIPRGASHE